MEEKKIQLWKLNIHYKLFQKDSDSDTILILHGWGGKSDSWIEVSKILHKNDFTVIIPDLPGFWKTKLPRAYTLEDYAKTTEEFIKKIWLKNFILLGHSNGGAISIKLANKKTLDIQRLILNNSAGIRTKKSTTLKRKIFKCIIKPFKFLAKYKYLRSLFYRVIWGQDYLATSDNPLLKKTFLNIINTDLQKDLKKISLNTLLIWWEKDTYTPLSDGNIMRKYIKHSKMVTLFWEKHGIHLQNPRKLVRTILKNI